MSDNMNFSMCENMHVGNEKQQLECDYQIFTHDSDAFGLWRADAAFRLMQELGGAHSTALGFSRARMLESTGCIWMLARVQLLIHRYPKLSDTLHAKTWYGPPGRTTYPRYISVQDKAEEEVAALSTSWIVVDMEQRRIQLPAKVGLVFPPALTIQPTIPEPARIRLRKPGTATVSYRTPVYSDLDVNGHVNNANYVSWILDVFPMDWHARHRVRSLCIGYLAEARPGQCVELALYQEGLLFELLGTDKQDGRTLFEASGEWFPLR